jgi:hypothetical protein
MNKIHVASLLCLFIFLCACANETKSAAEKEEKKEQELKVEKPVQADVVDKEMIVGNWRMTALDGKSLPDDRKDVTAKFISDGNFERKGSATSEPQKGTWRIEANGDKKILRINVPSNREMNEIIKLSADELIFMNNGKPVTLSRIKE